MKKIRLFILISILAFALLSVSCGNAGRNNSNNSENSDSSIMSENPSSELSSEAGSSTDSKSEEISGTTIEDMSEELVSLPFIPFG